MKKKSFIKGAAVLGIAGLIGKVIGAFYRIPLTNIIGAEGMGLYQIAYPIYAFLLVISTTGFPTAISKMVAERIARGDLKEAHSVFRISFGILTILGIVTTGIMLLGNGLFAKWIGNPKASVSIAAIAPALFFVSILSSYRGYFQGMQMMEPTAVSQVLEQLGKLLIGFNLAYRFKSFGTEYGAAGALTGVTLSEIAALVLLVGVYNRKKRDIQREYHYGAKPLKKESFTAVGWELAKIAVPVTLGASLIPLVSFLDTAIVINRLKDVGVSVARATALFGDLTAVVNPLVNMPAVLTTALAMSLVPAISESHALKDNDTVREKAAAGLRLAFLIGFPCAAGLFVLAHPIVALLYRSLEPDHIMTASALLRTMAAAVLFLSTVQTLTGILQGLGKVFIPVRNLLIGAILKVIVNYILIGIPSIHIQGAPVGTVICYGTAAVLNILAVIRETGMKFSILDMLIKPLSAAGSMSVVVWFTDEWAKNNYSSGMAVFMSIALGAFVYFAVLIGCGAIGIDDILMIPGGRKIVKTLQRIGIWT